MNNSEGIVLLIALSTGIVLGFGIAVAIANIFGWDFA